MIAPMYSHENQRGKVTSLSFLKQVEKRLKRLWVGDRRRLQFYADGLGVKGRTLDFLEEGQFLEAWNEAVARNESGWQKAGGVPDIRWRAHVACWAADFARNLEGDFVEFGVHTGLLSLTICHYLDFAKIDKKFYLFDTFKGIPASEKMSDKDRKKTEKLNDFIYFDVFEIAKNNFSPFSNVELVAGELPGTIEKAGIQKISYVSIDLNSCYYEKETIQAVWDKIVSHGIIVIDDYLFKGHEDQYEMWNDFAKQHKASILRMPTGQGLLIKS